MRIEPVEQTGPVTGGKIGKTGTASLLTAFGFFGVVQFIDNCIRNVSSEPNPSNQFILNMASLGGAALVAMAVGYPMFDNPEIWRGIMRDFDGLSINIKALIVGGLSTSVLFGLTMTIINTIFFFDSEAHLSPKELFYGSMLFLALIAAVSITFARVHYQDKNHQATEAELVQINTDKSRHLAPFYGTTV